MNTNHAISQIHAQIQQALPNVPLQQLLQQANLHPELTPQEQLLQLQNFLSRIHEYDVTKKNHLLKSHRELRFSKMSGPKKLEILNYTYEADILLQDALPFTFTPTRYLHLLAPSKKDSGYFDFSNFIQLGLLKDLPYEKEGLFATYFHENGHRIHYTTTENPFVDWPTAEKNHQLFKQLLNDAYKSQTFKQLMDYYPQSDYLHYIISEPEIIARMIESYCLHFHNLAEKTAKNRVPYWQFSKEDVQNVPSVLRKIRPTNGQTINASQLNIYLSFVGVLSTSQQLNLEFDSYCIDKFRKLVATCKAYFPIVNLSIIDDCRFRLSKEEITEKLTQFNLLEQIDQLIIPTQFTDSEQEILHQQQQGHFLIFSQKTYEHPYLEKHQIPLANKLGLKGVTLREIKDYLQF
ncbi:hypothetical protein OCI51_26005 (plasmid) [Lysinibacillus capsici]|uniref:hypothetical protein n=1 Tax=Lysinibacillus capsici TaxID=2115968 RepID=UPI0021D8176A|nr:hypothetical protein [Lysinibacillus capsici]UYB50114.1 hypothetical protein OCI51_26005 [Lysinibacillus capsici]